MSTRTKKSCLRWSLAAATVMGMSMSAWAYTQSSVNPRWLEIKGQPILPVGSDEHYGAVIHKCFNYIMYLDSMAGYDQTMTQIYAGGWYHEGNPFGSGCGNGDPLAPNGENLLTPWAWTGSKFDLDNWNGAYFTRLHDFFDKARDRGIMVMVALANGMYGNGGSSPLYGPNTIQNSTGSLAQCDFQYMDGNANLYKYQVKYIKKMVYELNSYDNLEWYVIDEPNTGGCNDSRINTWASALIDTIYNCEGTLSQRHVISIDGAWGATKGLSNNSHLSGQQDLGQWYTDPDRKNRYTFANEQGLGAGTRHLGEVWGIVFTGGASAQHLSYTWSGSGCLWVGREGGSSNQKIVWKGLQALSKFINSVNFNTMTRNVDLEVSPGWAGLCGQRNGRTGLAALGDSTNHEYAIYRNRDNCNDQSCNPGASASENITMRFPNGTYKYEWVNVLDASVMGSGTFTASGSNTVLATPAYQIAICLRVKQTNQVPTVPHIRLPWSGKTGLATGPMLSWWGVWYATSIHCQVSTHSDMSAPVVDDATLSGNAVSKALSGLSNNTTYYWRVRSTNANGSSAWSPVWRFGTGTPTGVIPDPVMNGKTRSGLTIRAGAYAISVRGSAGSAVAIYDAKGRQLGRAFFHAGQIAVQLEHPGIVFIREEKSGRGGNATAVPR